MENFIGARLIETLTAALYSDPIILFREYVQNSVDSFQANHDTLQKKDFKVLIKIDRQLRKIEIRDNGFGIPRERFFRVMSSISNSDKQGKNNQIGFKGIGRLSGLPFCEKLIFKNKPDNNDEVQIFKWDSKGYFDMLNLTPNKSLETCISKITSTDTEINRSDNYFSVILDLFNQEVDDLIFEKNGELSKDFINELSILLPVPYKDDFTYKDEIKKQYADYLGKHLDVFEYNIFVNDDQLFKPYNNNDIKNNDIHFLKYSFPEEIDSQKTKIGIMWFSFDYVFKAYSGYFGITTRSKNMLVNKSPIFADECSKSKDSPTTYTQLINGLKGIKGELLIDSSLLHDNSKRDWFIYDEYGLFLRAIIVDFMKRLNIYRRTASRVFNSEKITDQQKENLVKVFNDFTESQEDSSFYLKVMEKDQKAVTTNEKNNEIFFSVDELKQFKNSLSDESINIIKLIIEELYNYFTNVNKKEDFYKLKQKIIERMQKEIKI